MATMSRTVGSAARRRGFAAQYGEKQLKEEYRKDPVNVPRVAVWVGMAALIGLISFRQSAKIDSAAADRHNVIDEHVPPKPADPVKKAADVTRPFTASGEMEKMNAIKDKGLGVTEHSNGDKKH